MKVLVETRDIQEDSTKEIELSIKEKLVNSVGTKEIPVLYNFNTNVGKATNFRLEGSQIFADVELTHVIGNINYANPEYIIDTLEIINLGVLTD